MKLFTCANCQNILYFENTRCEKCDMALGYWPDANRMVPIASSGNNWQAVYAGGQRDSTLPLLRRCANADCGACNWMLAADDPASLCLACRHNGIIPSLADAGNIAQWRKVERAKRRLFYSLLRMVLPRTMAGDDTNVGLVFDVLADMPDSGTPKVLTGHENGRITLALAEADDAERERRRAAMGEQYRSLLGHFRHEIGHYYWELLISGNDALLQQGRDLFGDERTDYAEALKHYYSNGARPDWCTAHVSAYATAHPWEDFAESFAHYMHIMDTLEMAASFGVRLRPRLASQDAHFMAAEMDFDPFAARGFNDIIDAWLPLTYMANNLNRCMGAADLYPFTLTAPVCEKLAFIHAVAGSARFGNAAQPG